MGMLTGEVRQGRIGIGFATLRDATSAPVAVPQLTVRDVDVTLDRLARARGPGSATTRNGELLALLGRASQEEQVFLRALLLGELRQGALEGVMVDALARATGIDASAVRRAVMLAGSLATAARTALSEGEAGLARFGLELFRPLHPMLAQTAEDTGEALARLGRVAVEYKLDGARIQIHRVGDDVRVFTRALHDVTAAVPEIVTAVQALPVRQVVLDGEAIALRPDGTPQPFQVTMRRVGRRQEVAGLRDTLPLAPYFFDCLHVDGLDLIDRPGAERWQMLESAVDARHRIPRRILTEPGAVHEFLAEAIEHGHEGIMMKSLDAVYEAGRRGASWLKLKPAHTLDLVVLAAEWGSGRRRGWLSNLHLGARDPAAGGFVMLGKTFKGMTDEMLRWQTERLLGLEMGRDAYTVYVRPELVVEILLDGVQASPHYPAGLALRFARVRRYRPDKRADEADTIEAVRAIHTRR